MRSFSQLPMQDKVGPRPEIKMPFLVLTPNLIVRSMTSHDKPQMMESLKHSLTNLHMWFPWIDTHPDVEEYINICDTLYRETENKDAYHFIVFHHEVMIGMCSVLDVNIERNSAYLGYWCRYIEEGINFGEAINAILRYCFEQTPIEEFLIPCLVGNFNNELIAKELNFKLRSIDLINGKQIKIFKMSDISDLPTISIKWLSEPTSLLLAVE